MKTITVSPKNKKHLSKIKAALKLVDANFEINEKTITNPELIRKIEASHKEKGGKLLTAEYKKELFSL